MIKRSDYILKTEYNFVTRGFEHQYNFNEFFAETLRNNGAGLFAQFQTRPQIDILEHNILAIPGMKQSLARQSRGETAPTTEIIDQIFHFQN